MESYGGVPSHKELSGRLGDAFPFFYTEWQEICCEYFFSCGWSFSPRPFTLMHLSCLHSHCNRNQGHKIHKFSPSAVSYKARISGMSWNIISGLVCWVTFPHCSWCPPVMSKLWQFLILHICKGRLFFILQSVWYVIALHGVFHNMTNGENLPFLLNILQPQVRTYFDLLF